MEHEENAVPDRALFELTDTALERIVFAMEDQSKSKRINLATGELSDTGAPPPVWTPADGFKLMEGFCLRVTSLELRRRLMGALSRGKGVFKAFRQVLSEYPNEDLQFRDYKNAILRGRVEAWMDELREASGLARLGPEPEEYEDLADEEFAIEKGGLGDLGFDLGALIKEAGEEALEGLPAAAMLEECALSDYLSLHAERILVHWIGSEEGPPIAAAAGCLHNLRGASVGLVRFVWAAEGFRSLGLEYRLASSLAEAFRASGAESCFLASLFSSPDLSARLAERGLEPLSSMYSLG